jgi:hypothetical protein
MRMAMMFETEESSKRRFVPWLELNTWSHADSFIFLFLICHYVFFSTKM